MIKKKAVEEYKHKLESKPRMGDEQIQVAREDLEQFVNLYDEYVRKDKELRAIQTSIQAERLVSDLNLQMDVFNIVSLSNKEDLITFSEIVSSIMEDIHMILHDDCFPDERKSLLIDSYMKAKEFSQEIERAVDAQVEENEPNLEM